MIVLLSIVQLSVIFLKISTADGNVFADNAAGCIDDDCTVAGDTAAEAS